MKLVKMLIDEGADIHRSDSRVLVGSVDNYNPLVTKFLIDSGSDLKALNRSWILRYICRYVK